MQRKHDVQQAGQRPLHRFGKTLFLIVLMPAAASAQAPDPVDVIIAKANHRLAAGDDPSHVESWMRDAVHDAGLRTDEPPLAWNVYAGSRWRRDLQGHAAGVAADSLLVFDGKETASRAHSTGLSIRSSRRRVIAGATGPPAPS